jgi:hypothetical protein
MSIELDRVRGKLLECLKQDATMINPRLFMALLEEFIDAKFVAHSIEAQQCSAVEQTKRIGEISITDRTEFAR